MEIAIEVKNLKKSYQDFLLNNISFTLPKGMVMGFIGSNGSGKTTTIKCLLNNIKYEGSIKIFGYDIKLDEDKIKEDLGVVLDDAFFPEILFVKDINTIMKSIYKNWDSLLFNKYLRDFDLPSNKKIKDLSKGMRKKLEIISCLSHHPKLLILDEPTSGLDPIARNEVIDLFRDFIQNEDCSILISSHITSDLEAFADYITFIDKGNIILSKNKDEIINNYGCVKCSEDEFKKIDKNDYIKYKKNKYDYELLIDDKKKFKKKYDIKVIDNINLENLMVMMIRGEN